MTAKNIRPLGICQTTGPEHQQEKDQDNAAYRYIITSGIEEGRFGGSRGIYLEAS